VASRRTLLARAAWIAAPVAIALLMVVVLADLATTLGLSLKTTPSSVSVLWDSSSPVGQGGRAHSATFNGVACPRDGDCVAYGSDVAAHGVIRPLLVTERGGSWAATTLQLPVGATPNKDSSSEIDAVACPGSTCIAVGDYTDTRGAEHLFSNSVAHPRTVSELPLVGGAEKASALATGPDEEARVSLACWSASGCLAAVTIDFSIGGELEHDAIEFLRFDGRQWTPVPDPAKGISPSNDGVEVTAISCTERGWCAVAGDTTDAMGDSETAWSAVPRGDAWAARMDPGLESFEGLSCAAADTCRALAVTSKGNAIVDVAADGTVSSRALRGGFDYQVFDCTPGFCVFGGASASSFYGYLGSASGTVLSTTRAAPTDRRMIFSYSDDVTCASSSLCLVAGGYEAVPGVGTSEPLVELYSHGTWTATSPALPPDVYKGVLNGIACSRQTHCVAIGQAGGTVMP
jgi:hypothetical protein